MKWWCSMKEQNTSLQDLGNLLTSEDFVQSISEVVDFVNSLDSVILSATTNFALASLVGFFEKSKELKKNDIN